MIKQKSQEQLQAQVAVYAEEQIERQHPGRRRALLEQVGSVVVGDELPADSTYPRTVAHKRFNEEGEVEVVSPIGHPEPLFVGHEYTDSLKNPANLKKARNLAEMIGAWKGLEPEIAKLGILGLDIEQAKKHPNFLGHGGSEMAFKFTIEDEKGQEKTYVARYDQGFSPNDTLGKINSRANALALGKGIGGLEQGVALSYDPPMVITEFITGKAISDFTDEDWAGVSQEKWQALETTITGLNDAGIGVDHNTDNILYDPASGFNIIDYRNQNEPEARRFVNASAIANLREVSSRSPASPLSRSILAAQK